MIRIVRGNRFRLLIPLELTTTEGGVSKTEKYTPTEQCRVCPQGIRFLRCSALCAGHERACR